MKKLSALLAFCFVAVFAMADKQVSGVVTDEKGDPIVGAAIQVIGTTLGTISDYDGAFSISVPDNAQTVVISYLGMQQQELPIKSVMNVVMHENSEVIQEVVVTGYGNVSKGSFAGSAQAVDAETIEKKSPSEISKALTGEVAGVQVVNASGQPGTNGSIRIRGIGSVYASTQPLYVVDGVTYDGDISSIDPGDIASTTILKDATATSLYGSRGANGVIVITTKKGTSGETGKIDVDVKYGANMHLLPMYEVVTDPKEYVEMAWMGIYNNLSSSITNPTTRGTATNKTLYGNKGLAEAYNLWDAAGSALIDPTTGKFFSDVKYKSGYENMTSWEDAIFRVGQKLDATVRISGGSEKTTYFTSFGYLKDEGYYINSDYSRFTVRSNIEHQAKKWLKGSLNMAYAYSTMNAAGQGDNMNNGFAFVNGIPPIYPVYLYNADGTIQVDPKTGGYAYDYGMTEGSGRGFGTNINPAGSLQYDRDYTVQHQLMSNGVLEFKLYDGLKFTVNVGVQYVGANNSEFTNAYYGDAGGVGRIYKTQQNYLSLTANQMLEYNKTFGEHSIRAMAGHETNFVSSSVMYGGKYQVAATNGPSTLEWSNAVNMSSMASYTQQQAIDSYFANLTYMYNERYGVTANYRADGSSKFAKGHRWGHFGSIGGSWSFTNESFLENNEWIKNGKLRLSWGVLGNQGVSSYLYTDRYAISYVDGQVGYVWSGKGSADLTWERSSQFDLGLEFDINKYLTAEFDYFYKYTTNMLMPRYTASSQGYTAVWVNEGKMQNQGVEMQFNIHAVDKDRVRLDIRLNGGHYANKIKELPKNANTDTEMVYNGGMAVGHSLYDYNMVEYAGVDAETGKSLYVGYYDANLGGFGGTNAENLMVRGEKGTNYISNVFLYREKHPNADIQTELTTEYSRAGYDYIGKSAQPGLDGGFGFNLEAYGVTLDVSCSYRIGGWGYDSQYASLMSSDKAGGNNWHVDMRNAWNEMMTDEQKANATVPRLSNGSDVYANAGSTRFLISNSYLSLNNIRLGYNFPKKLISKNEKFKLNLLSLYVTADNLAILSARKGYNPMTSFAGSSDAYQYTPLSTIMGGIKFQF